MTFEVVCGRCAGAVQASRTPACSSCGRSSIQFRYPDLTASLREALLTSEDSLHRGLWRFRSLLPVDQTREPVGLGEGSTALVVAPRILSDLRARPTYLKLEGANPSGSFKDRCSAVALTKALEFGVDAVAIASAGNAGASAAAYAARAGIPCYVLVPATTPDERLTQAQLAGARVIRVKDATVNDCSDLVRIGVGRYGWYSVTTASTENAYQSEATRTIAYEIVEQLDGRAPDWLITPVGGGGLLAGVAQGFRDLHTAGIIDEVPRFGAVQPEGCAPLVRAINEAQDPDHIRPWGNPESIATSIADPFPMDGYRAVRAVTECRGAAVAVSDHEIRQAEWALGRTEGLFVEPASATAVAGLRRLLDSGTVGAHEVTVVVASGTGFKDLGVARSLVRPAPVIEPVAEALFATVDAWYLDGGSGLE